ncbi:MAG: c-type cytochrome [Burkholderiaceae bacterium]|nr:c-type cytochrome [Burkholderiaceae bacterium]
MNRAFLPVVKSMLVAMLAASSVAIVTIGTAQAAAAGDPAKGATLYATGDAARAIPPCVSCHGPDGNSVITQNPKLAAQHAAYIVKQLANFKSGERNNPVMGMFAKALTEEEARNVAAYLSAQSQAPGAAKNKDTLDFGKKIYRAGIAEKGVPACAGCHGPAGAGIPAKFARIGGQHQDYTIAQLTNFNNGTRNNNPIMTTVAKRLSPEEIQAVADYVAGLK